jgi:suppressor for copper-sensitivity B
VAAPLMVPTVRPAGRTGAVTADETVRWVAFDPAAIAGEIAAGHTVFVDVTADWCLTCQVNKALVIDSAPIQARLNAPRVVAMRADWTRPDPVIAAFLHRYGRFGIPFNVVFGPGTPAGRVLPELLSRDAIAAALDAAAGNRRTAGR